MKRLSPILEAAHARLVIAVDDLDRNQSSKFDPKDVLATMQRLRAVRGVSFILTGGAIKDSKIDFARLCDHIEPVPALNEDFVIQIIRTLRQYCLSRVAVNPNETRERSEEDLWGNVRVREHIFVSLGVDGMTAAGAAMRLLSTPRSLKHALRHTLGVWESLAGEVDFDDLLILNALRYGAPEAFNFLLRRMDRLRAKPERSTDRDDRERVNQELAEFREEWKQASVGTDWNAAAALELVCFLLPNASPVLADKPQVHSSCPQGVRHTSPTDYLRRILQEELPADEVRDQEILQAIDGWTRNPQPATALVQRLSMDERFADIWEHFADRIPARMLLDLADQVIAAVLRKDRARASEDHPGIAALRRRVTTRGADEPRNARWLSDAIRVALPVSIRLAGGLFEDWTQTNHSFLKKEEVLTIRAEMVKAARAAFVEAEPEALVRALDVTHPYALRWLVLPPSIGPGVRTDQLPDWTWLGPVLLAAAKAQPEKMIPQIGQLLMEPTGSPRKGQMALMPDRVTVLFGDRVAEMLELLAQGPEGASDEDRPFLEMLKQRAQDWLARPPAPDEGRQTPGADPCEPEAGDVDEGEQP